MIPKGDEISESAKAVQELAKATDTGIKAAEKLGGFFSRVFGESIDQAAGMIADSLKVRRFERQILLAERVQERLREKGVAEKDWRQVNPKFGLPILQHASLEENDDLHILYSRLLAAALDPNFDSQTRMAFAEIIRELEVVDVHVFDFIFQEYKKRSGIRKIDPARVPIDFFKIAEALELDSTLCREALDNLFRQRCVCPAIEIRKMSIPREKQRNAKIRVGGTTYNPTVMGSLETETILMPIAYSYEKVCITPMGLSFALACIEV